MVIYMYIAPGQGPDNTPGSNLFSRLLICLFDHLIQDFLLITLKQFFSFKITGDQI